MPHLAANHQPLRLLLLALPPPHHTQSAASAAQLPALDQDGNVAESKRRSGFETSTIQYHSAPSYCCCCCCCLGIIIACTLDRTGCKCDVPPALRTQHVSPPHSSAGCHLASHHHRVLVPRRRSVLLPVPWAVIHLEWHLVRQIGGGAQRS